MSLWRRAQDHDGIAPALQQPRFARRCIEHCGGHDRPPSFFERQYHSALCRPKNPKHPGISSQ